MNKLMSWLGRQAPPEPHLLSINDLEDDIRVRRAQINRLDIRGSVPIAAIDDQPFEPATNLRHNHYNIVHLNDIQNIDEIKAYPIILCDLQGVGANLDPKLQGAHLI